MVEHKRFISRQTVVNYINELPITRLMHFMNYRIKQKKIVECNSNFKKIQQQTN